MWQKNNKCLPEWRETGTSVHCHWECKMTQALPKAVRWILKTFNKKFHRTQKSPPRYTQKGTNSSELNRYLFTYVHSNMIHEIQNMEGTQWPSSNEWISTFATEDREFYSALLGKRILAYTVTKMNVHGIMLRKISQIPYGSTLSGPRAVQLIETNSRIVDAEVEEEGLWGWLFIEAEFCFCADGRWLRVHSSVSVLNTRQPRNWKWFKRSILSSKFLIIIYKLCLGLNYHSNDNSSQVQVHLTGRVL